MRKLAIAAVLCAWLSAAAQAAVIYVDADAVSGADDGTSWTDAYLDLQSALTDPLLTSGDEIWVAEGIYKPTGDADRTVSFALVSNIDVYGGFDGTETTLGERDPDLHETILSGDIATGASSDNSFHVVIGASDAVLDGFTVTGGNADGSYPYDLSSTVQARITPESGS